MEAVIEFIKVHSVIITVLVIGIVYFSAKWFCFNSYPCGLELFTPFLLYEFTSLKKILTGIASNMSGFQFYIKVLAEKHLGKVTMQDILRTMRDDND